MALPHVPSYPPAVAALLDAGRLMPLGPGRPERARQAGLHALGDQDLGTVIDPAMAAACRAGLFLYWDFLDESHALSQDIPTPTGSYWHGVMHRREPDASNSKYWFRRVGPHPVLEQLARQAAELGYDYTGPFDFIDFVERVRDSGGPDEELARRVQQLEWQLLFDWCYRKTVS